MKTTSETPTADRLPPFSLEAEQGALGCILGAALTGAPGDAAVCMDRVIERAGRDGRWFYDFRHLEIWRAMERLHADRKPIDLILLRSFLQNTDKLDDIGGLAYLSELQDAAPSPTNLDYYLDILHEKFLARQALRIAAEVTQSVYRPDGDGSTLREAVSKLEADVLALTADHAGKREQTAAQGARMMADLIDQMKRGQGMVTGLQTRFEYFDRMTTGLHPGEMTVLAGRPSTGKTMLAMNIARNVSYGPEGTPCGVFSLEMNDIGIWSRFLFQVAGVDYQKFRSAGFTTNEDTPKIAEGIADMEKFKIFMDDTAGLTLSEIRARARRMKREHSDPGNPTDTRWLWVIDYFSLITPDRRDRDRLAEMSEISRGVKAMAKELNDHVILLAQLNRDSAKENRTPEPHDLKECGQLEQDADLIVILHRPKLRTEPFEGRGRSERDMFEENLGAWHTEQRRINAHVCKQRNGPTGPVELVAMTKSMNFVEFDRDVCRFAVADAVEQWEE